jgi:hypothetical protein
VNFAHKRTETPSVISIVPFIPPINGLVLPRQVPIQLNNTSVIIQISDIFLMTITFDTTGDKTDFLNALGNNLDNVSQEKPNNSFNFVMVSFCLATMINDNLPNGTMYHDDV